MPYVQDRFQSVILEIACVLPLVVSLCIGYILRMEPPQQPSFESFGILCAVFRITNVLYLSIFDDIDPKRPWRVRCLKRVYQWIIDENLQFRSQAKGFNKSLCQSQSFRDMSWLLDADDFVVWHKTAKVQ